MATRQSQLRCRAAFFAALLLLVSLWPESSLAGDWRLEAKATEKVDFNDNYGLKGDPEGVVIGSTTSLNTNAIYKGHDYRFDLVGDLSYRDYFGPGADDISSILNPRIETKFSKTGKTAAFDFAASFARTEASSVDDLEPIIIPIKTYRDALNVSSSYRHSFGPRSTAGVTASFQKVMFEDSGANLTPSMSSSLGLFWSERLTKRTTLTANTSASWLVLDDLANTNRETLLGRLSVSSQLSPRLRFQAGAGVQVIFSQLDAIIPPIDEPVDTAKLGWSGDFRLDYTYKLGTISAFATHATEPATLGDLQRRYTFGLFASRKINEISGLNLSLQYRIAEIGPDENQHVLTLSPTYALQLTDDWSMQTGYKFTYVSDDAGDAKSNNLFLSVSKALTISP